MRLKVRISLLLVFLLLYDVGVTQAVDSPSARMGHSMVYDPIGERVLLFGGSIWQNQYTFYNDLWSFSDGAWTEINVPGTKPSGRFNIPMVYIPDTHQILIFGGFGSSDRIGDTWIYDIEANQWNRIQTRTTPPPRSDAAIAYDEKNQVVVMFGGYGLEDHILGDTWVFDFVDMNWGEMNSINKPLIQYGGHMVYDSVSAELLMYPGHWNIESDGNLLNHGYGDEVWAYSYEDNDWTEYETSPKPRGRYWFNLAYDAESGQMVLFGGSSGGDNQLSDTWLYDRSQNSWSEITSQPRPSVRANSAMAYDASLNSVVLFGGSHFGAGTYDDTWILDMENGVWLQVDVGEEVQPETQSTSVPGFTIPAILLGTVFIIWINRSCKLRV
jgi:hypothetical protein